MSSIFKVMYVKFNSHWSEQAVCKHLVLSRSSGQPSAPYKLLLSKSSGQPSASYKLGLSRFSGQPSASSKLVLSRSSGQPFASYKLVMSRSSGLLSASYKLVLSRSSRQFHIKPFIFKTFSCSHSLFDFHQFFSIRCRIKYSFFFV